MRELRKGGSEPSTVGTRTGSEAESRGRAGEHKRSPRVIDGDGRARRREATGWALTRRDPAAERRREVSRGHSSVRGTHEPKGVPSEGLKERTEPTEALDGMTEGRTKQRGATTAVTTPDWLTTG